MTEQTDAQLLGQFAAEHSEAAFEALMERHGPMVMGVCRRMVGNPQDAEDAFQATFLLLVERCNSIGKPRRLAGWLYGVAYRIAARIRHKSASARSREVQALDVPLEPAVNDASWKEVRGVLDDELNQLPARLRLPLVLCYLRGMTNAEAAEELGWPVGSISRRLARGRETLRGRLALRGVTLSLAALTLLLERHACAAALPIGLAEYVSRSAALRAAGKTRLRDAVSPAVAGTIDDVTRTLLYERLQVPALAALVAFLLIGLATIWQRTTAPEGPISPTTPYFDPSAVIRREAPTPAARQAGEPLDLQLERPAGGQLQPPTHVAESEATGAATVPVLSVDGLSKHDPAAVTAVCHETRRGSNLSQ